MEWLAEEINRAGDARRRVRLAEDLMLIAVAMTDPELNIQDRQQIAKGKIIKALSHRQAKQP